MGAVERTESVPIPTTSSDVLVAGRGSPGGAFLLLSGVCALVALVWHHMAILGDGFWYIATGRLLLATGRMPVADPFSFASAPGQWHVVSAISEILFATVADHAGLRALLVLVTLIEGLSVVAVWLAWAPTPLARLLTLPLAFLFVQIDSQDLSARGQVFGDLGFVTLLCLVLHLRKGRKVHPIVAFALGVLWVNLHLSFQLAVVVPIVFAGTLLFDPSEQRPPLLPFVTLAAFAFLGFFVNPYGASYFPVIWKLTFSPQTARFDLFQSPDFHDLPWLVGPALGLALAIWRFLDPSPWRRSESLLLVGFVLAACFSRRYVPQLFTVQAAVLGRLVSNGRSVPSSIVTSLCGLLSVPLAIAAIFWIREPKDPLRDVPASAAALIHDRGLPGNIMNPLHWGGYLAFAWKGEPRYFIDGRDHVMLYGNGAFDDSTILRSGAPGWQDILDVYSVRTVLWERGMPLDWLLAHDAQWQRVYEDRIAVVYTKR